MADYDVIVIGAGCGGLSVGSQLAKQGRKVLILEQSSLIGGCCSTFEKDGFRFDLGASLIEDVNSIDTVFKRLGTSLWDEVDLISCDPTYTVVMRDGTRIKYPLSIDESAEQIRKIAPEDVEGWYKFCTYMENFLAGGQDFFRLPANTLADMGEIARRSPGMYKFAPLLYGSYQDVLEKFFKNDKVRESLAYQCLFIGLPPEICPGLYALIPRLEHNGIFYSRGGMIGIPAALKRCGEKFGMEVRLKSLVEKVIIENKRAIGVKLSDGTKIFAKIVVSDINAKLLYFDLIGQEHLPWLSRVGLKSYEYSVAVPMLYLGVDYTPPLESHHTLATVPMRQISDFWWNMYKKGRYTDEQFGIISWTSGSDPSLAPSGHHVIILTLAPGAYKLQGTTWDDLKPSITEKIINYMSDHYIPGLKEHVKVAELATPIDFERRLRTPEGAIYALRQDIANTTMFRPSSRSKSIDGLYLVGASTHPGGGVPVTISSGLIAADLIEKYE